MTILASAKPRVFIFPKSIWYQLRRTSSDMIMYKWKLLPDLNSMITQALPLHPGILVQSYCFLFKWARFVGWCEFLPKAFNCCALAQNDTYECWSRLSLPRTVQTRGFRKFGCNSKQVSLLKILSIIHWSQSLIIREWRLTSPSLRLVV